MNQNRLKPLLKCVLIFLVAWNASCGKGSSRGSQIRGVVHADRVDGATVTLRELNDGALGNIVASGTSFPDGSYSLEAVGSLGEGSYLLVAAGGSFIDEATGQVTQLDSTLQQLILAGEETLEPQPITPLTDLVARRTLNALQSVAAESRTDILPVLKRAATREVATLLGIQNCTSPFDAIPISYAALDGDASSTEAKASSTMAVLSQVAKVLGYSPGGFSGVLNTAFAGTGRMDVTGWTDAVVAARGAIGSGESCFTSPSVDGGGHVNHVVLFGQTTDDEAGFATGL